MIDTIVLRVHHLSNYPQIYAQFYSPSSKKNSFTTAYVDEDTGEIIDTISTTKSLAAIYHDSDRLIPITHRSHVNIASSHYSLSYSINTNLDYLEFNFAIPKYLYATNLIQFVSIYNHSCDTQFLMLKDFLFNFFKQNFIQTPLFEDIEVHRIDLCYNQFFNNKEDALQYLDEQKKLLIKYARSSKNKFRTYDTSFMYVTRRYSFKIYHKGTEFRKNDYKELQKHGNKKNYPLGEFLTHADNILRYEMTFRKSYLNYLMQHYFFTSVKHSQNGQYTRHKLYKLGRVMAQYSNGDTSFKGNFQGSLDEFNSRSKMFTLQSVFDHTDDEISLFMSDAVTFDRTIFGILYDTFWDKVMEYQLNKMISITEIQKRIDEHNESTKVKNKLRRNQESGKDNFRILSTALLSNFMPIEELKAFMPESSYFRLKADLKKIGISTSDTNLNVPTPRVDYLDYRLYFSMYH